MLTLNEAIIDVKKVKSKALKWFSIFLKITTPSKTTPNSMPYFAIITFNTYSKNLPILCLQFLKAVMKLSQ